MLSDKQREHPVHTLSIQRGDHTRDYLASSDQISLGRSQSDNPADIQLDDPYVSRHHADIHFLGPDQLRIVNHGSLIRCENSTEIETGGEASFFLPLELTIGETTIHIHATESDEDSVYDTVVAWVQRLQEGDEAAATEIWEAYYRRLLGLARVRMNQLPKRAVDEEDIVLNAFDSFFRGVKEQRFVDLADRTSLWRILAMLTSRKVAREIEQRMSQKRGEGKVRGESVFQPTDDGDGPGLGDHQWDSMQQPDFLAQMREEMDGLLARLEDEELRTIAMMKLEGSTNKEIADHLGVTERTVERKLKKIRDAWSSTIE